MKTIFVKCLAPALLLGALALPVAAQTNHPYRPGGINARLHHQSMRIERGEQSGRITEREANRLEARDARINRQEARARRSGGKFTYAERMRLQRELNHSNRGIHRQAHDNQHR